MSLANAVETSILALIFNATPWANIAINATSSPATNLYVSLHTADPTDAGAQDSSEISYTGYARPAVSRDSGGWTVASGQAANAAAVSTGACTAGSGTATHFGVGLSSSGAGTLLGSGALTASLAVSAGITPSAAIGALTVTLD